MKSGGFEIREFQDGKGRSPFRTWLDSIKDKKLKATVYARLSRLEKGNLGDCKSVGGGVFELRIHLSPGIRVYFGFENNTVVILLCGGEKRTQEADIERAQRLWIEYGRIGR